MASQSHTTRQSLRTAAKHSADGTTRADKWGDDVFPYERVRAFTVAVETCTRFTETDLTVDWEGLDRVEILLTTHDRILSPELMSVLVEYDAVIELLTSSDRWNKSTWRVALPVED